MIIERPLSIPLWEVLHMVQELKREADAAPFLWDDPHLEKVLVRAYHVMHRIVRDQVQEGKITEAEYDALLAKAKDYDGGGVDVDAGVFR